MEYHDKMKKLRGRNVIGAIILFILLTILISILYYRQNIFLSNFPIWIMLIILTSSLILTFIFFEFYRPDFVITDNYIIFSNLGLAYLLRKKNFVYLVPFKDIKEILNLDDRMGFEQINNDKYITIIDDQFDDYLSLKINILEIAKRYNIRILE